MSASRPICMLLLMLGFPSFLAGIQDESVTSRQGDLQKLRAEIRKYELQIEAQEKKETSSLDLLDSYDRQAVLLRRLVKNIQMEERALQHDIDSIKKEISELGGRITHLRSQYASYVSNMYRRGRTRDIELLLTSRSFNQMLVRAEYLKRFSHQRKRDVEEMSDRRRMELKQRDELEERLQAQRVLLAEKGSEEKKLSAQAEKRKRLLAEIRRDKKQMKKEFERAVSAAKELESLIAVLIEKEREKKKREAELAKEGQPVPPRVAISGKPFAELKGQLPWPVSHGTVVAKFGNQKHPILRTVTQNTGIDISLPSGSSIEAVAEGEISTIHWLPSFGNLVIIDHTNGYRSVYAHLSEILVTEGQRVGGGMTIARSGESVTGPLLHFEIWMNRAKQNPEEWLSPRGLSRR